MNPPEPTIAAHRPSHRVGWTVLRRAAAVCTALIVTALAGPCLAAGPSGQVTESSHAAQRAEAAPAWSALTAQQRADLAPLQREWPTLAADRKEKWLVLAARLPRMSSTERDRIRARMAQWAQMSPAERGRARQNFQETRVARPEDREAQWRAYQALPAEQRKELAQRARPNAASQRPPPKGADAQVVSGNKRNMVQTQVPPPATRQVTPTIVQAKPGATTTLLSTPALPPLHNQPGLPKIVATDGFVNPSTLLPKRGPQGAAAQASAPERQ